MVKFSARQKLGLLTESVTFYSFSGANWAFFMVEYLMGNSKLCDFLFYYEFGENKCTYI